MFLWLLSLCAGMRILVTLLLDTLPMLGNVLLLCFFVFFIFGIVGVQLWAGLLRNRCFLGEDVRTYVTNPLSSSCTLLKPQELEHEPSHIFLPLTLFFLRCLSFAFRCAVTDNNGQTLPAAEHTVTTVC